MRKTLLTGLFVTAVAGLPFAAHADDWDNLKQKGANLEQEGKNLQQNIELKPGDTIIVP